MNNKNKMLNKGWSKRFGLITELNKSFINFSTIRAQVLGENESLESYVGCEFDSFEQEIYGAVFHKLAYFFDSIENCDNDQTDLEFFEELLDLLPARGKNILEYVGLDEVEEISDRWGVEENSPQELVGEYFDGLGDKVIWWFITGLTSKLINSLPNE